MSGFRLLQAVIGLATLLAVVMLPSPGLAAPSLDPARAKIFTIGQLGDLDSINPYAARSDLSVEVIDGVYDLLEGWSQQDYQPTPGLATSWTESADGLTWTFKIRKGVTWSDGVALTAADVAYTFTRTVADPSARVMAEAYVKNIKTVDAPTPTTVVFHLAAPDPVMRQLRVPILPEHIWSGVPANQTATYPNPTMVGSGPFTLDQWVKGQSVRLKANKHYWGGAPLLDYLVYREFPDENTMIQALERGDIDAVEQITPTAYAALAGQDDLTRIAGENPSITYLAFNVGGATVDNQPVGDGAPAARDPRFRQAVAYAIDRTTFTAGVLRGHGLPGQSLIPPSYRRYSYRPAVAAATYDPAKAQQLLDAAGYARDAVGFRLDPATGHELNLRILAPDDTRTDRQSVQVVVAELAAIGLRTTTQLLRADQVVDQRATARYDLILGHRRVEPDPSFELSTLTCGQRDTGSPVAPTAGWSDSFYCSPAYDELYAKQASQLDPDQRATTVRQMQQLLTVDVPYIVLDYPEDLEAYNSAKWVGVQFQPTIGGTAFFQYGQFTDLDLDVAPPYVRHNGTVAALSFGVGAAGLIVIILSAVWMIRRRGLELP